MKKADPKNWAEEKAANKEANGILNKMFSEIAETKRKRIFPRKMIVSNYPDFPKHASGKDLVLAEVPSLEFPFLTDGLQYTGAYYGYKYAKEIEK